MKSFSWVDLFFPGVIVHEIAHALACFVCGVKVHRISVHRNSGMVVHDKTTARSSLLIGLFPLLVGITLGFFLIQWGKQLLPQQGLLSFILIWIGFSAGFHAIPSVQDVHNIVDSVQRRYAELWQGSHHAVVKLAKSVWYAASWIGAWLLVGLAFIANASVIFRLALGLGVGWFAW